MSEESTLEAPNVEDDVIAVIATIASESESPSEIETSVQSQIGE